MKPKSARVKTNVSTKSADPATTDVVKPKKMGRPAEGDEPRKHRLPLVASASQAAAIREAAEAADETVSTWVLDACLQRLAREAAKKGRP
jgi:hypothetical protein